MNYGRGITTVRNRRGLSKRKLSALAGIAPSYVTHLEAGTKIPSLLTLESLARALDIPMCLLMLLSSDEEELKGIGTKGAETLGAALLDLLGPFESSS